MFDMARWAFLAVFMIEITTIGAFSSSAMLMRPLGGAKPFASPARIGSRFVESSNAFDAGLSLRSAKGSRRGMTDLKAALDGYSSLLSFDSPAAWAAFLLWATPIPLVVSGLCKVAEDNSGSSSIDPLSQGSGAAAAGEPGIQRNLMWAFPSFGCFLDSIDEQPPSFMPAWQKWALLFNGWGGIAWYLHYKYQIEEELKRYSGEGLGGLAVVAPFALGFFGGIAGEILFGSLEHEPLYDLCSTAFWGGFAWIYAMQFKLYSKVNELYQSRGLTPPLLVWGLLVPGYNFVTGIRQIHFLSQFWAMERREQPERDAFCELFPFATKPTLGVGELFTSPELWINWERMGLTPPSPGSSQG